MIQRRPSRVLVCAVAAVLAAASLQLHAQDPTPADLGDILAVLKDTGATTLAMASEKARLKGKVYTGVVEVTDVEEGGGAPPTYLVRVDPGIYNINRFMLMFEVPKDTAMRLRKGQMVHVTATLDRFMLYPSGYSNRADQEWVMFDRVAIQEPPSPKP